MAKICCGGFYLGEGLELDGRTLKATGGSGLPDPSELVDGTVMVAVDGEWKMQEGYGYIDGPFKPITWDGDTSGKPYIEFDGTPIYYKVSDDIITAEQFIGATFVESRPDGEHTNAITEEDIQERGGLVIAFKIMSGVAGAYGEGKYAVNVPEDGTYFFKRDGITVKSLTPVLSVHKFDDSFINFPTPEKSLSLQVGYRYPDNTPIITRAYLNGTEIDNVTFDVLKDIIFGNEEDWNLIPIYIYEGDYSWLVSDIYFEWRDVQHDTIHLRAYTISEGSLCLISTSIVDDEYNIFGEVHKDRYTLTPAT